MSNDLQRAINAFSDLLSLSDRQALGTQAPSHEDVLAFTTHIDALGSKRKARCLGRRFQPFLEFLQQFSAIIETFIQSNTQIASLVWGGMKTIITVLANFNDYFEKISEMFLKLGSVCPRFDRLQKIFPSSIGLREATCAFYATTVFFCTDVLKFLRSNSLKQLSRTIWKPFKSEFKEVESRLISQRDAIDLEVRIASESESRHERLEATLYRHRGDAHRAYEVKQWAETKKRNEIQERKMLRDTHLLKLSTHDHTSVFLRNKEKRIGELEDAASWFVKDKVFEDWSEGRSSGAFWCHGIREHPATSTSCGFNGEANNILAGSGKSVLTTSVLDYFFEKESDALICYFFCSYVEPESIEQQTIMSSLAKQILLIQDPWSSMITALVSGLFSGPIGKPSLSQLIVLLRALIEEQQRIVILLDGLDECTTITQRNVLSFFKDIFSAKRSTTVKVYLSSRTDLEASKVIKHCTEFNLDLATKRRTDIRSFISRKLQEAVDTQQIVALKKSTMNDIQDALENGSEGMFLWVSFQIEDICMLDNEEDIRDLIKSLPRGLDETYRRILQRIQKEKLPDVARRVFKWVAGAKRPLSLEELAEAAALDPKFKSLSEARISQDPVKMIRNCGNLVIVNELDRTVQFAHFTVKKYLTDDSSALKEFESHGKQSFWQDATWIDQELGTMCLSYITFSDFQTQVIRREDSNLALQKSMMEVAKTETWIPLVLGANSSIGSLLSYAASWIPSRKSISGGEAAYQFAPATKPKDEIPESLRSKYHLLDYVMENWIWHSKYLEEVMEDDDRIVREAARTFRRIVKGEGPSFLSRPWKAFCSEKEYDLGQHAVTTGDEALLKLYLMEINPAQKKAFQNRSFGENGESSLAFACGHGYDEVAKLLMASLGGLLQQASNVKSVLPPWILAAQAGKYELSCICMMGNVVIRTRFTPREMRVIQDTFEAILNDPISINEPGSDDVHVLFQLKEQMGYESFDDYMVQAIHNDCMHAVKRLSPPFGLHFAYTKDFDYFLQLAVSLGRVEIVRMFLQSGCGDANRLFANSFSNGSYQSSIPCLKAAGFRPNEKAVDISMKLHETPKEVPHIPTSPMPSDRKQEVNSCGARLNIIFSHFLISDFQEGTFLETLSKCNSRFRGRLFEALGQVTLPSDANPFDLMIQALKDHQEGAVYFLLAIGLPPTLPAAGVQFENPRFELPSQNATKSQRRTITSILAAGSTWHDIFLDCHLSAQNPTEFVDRVHWFLGSGIDPNNRLAMNLLYHIFTTKDRSHNRLATILVSCRLQKEHSWRRILFTAAMSLPLDELVVMGPMLVFRLLDFFTKEMHACTDVVFFERFQGKILPLRGASSLIEQMLKAAINGCTDITFLPDRALPMLCQAGHFPSAESLLRLKLGASSNETHPILGGTCLIWTIKHMNYEFVKRLLESGADANAKVWMGRTALHHCVAARMPIAVEMLLEHGAEPWHVDDDGKTALSLCLELENDLRAELADRPNSMDESGSIDDKKWRVMELESLERIREILMQHDKIPAIGKGI